MINSRGSMTGGYAPLMADACFNSSCAGIYNGIVIGWTDSKPRRGHAREVLHAVCWANTLVVSEGSQHLPGCHQAEFPVTGLLECFQNICFKFHCQKHYRKT